MFVEHFRNITECTFNGCLRANICTHARTHARIHAYTLRLKIHVNGFGSLKHTTATLSFLCFDFQAKKGTL